jgi:hypothetical protein
MKFLIDFKADAPDADISAYLQQHNCTILKEWNKFDKIFLVESETIPPSIDITDRIVEENHLIISPLEVTTLNPYYATHRDPAKETIDININDPKDWWKNYSRAQPEFLNQTTTLKRLGQNISVYLVDSGIEASHPEFENADITNIYSVTPGDFSDRNGHGTALASVIVGKSCGVTDAKLKIVKIFDAQHSTTEHEFLDAMDAIIADHVDGTYSVLNASWAIPKNEWVEHKLRILENEGIFIVASAGNNGSSIEDVTPASMIDVITVGAYNKDLEPCDFSNYTGGSTISVTGDIVNHGELDGWAPGEEIWTAGLNGTYGYAAGTSIAAAIASAVLTSNLTKRCYDDGTRIEGWGNAKVSTAAIMSSIVLFYRPDLLNLSNPNYQNSVNVIATFSDRDIMPVTQAPDEFLFTYVAGQELQGVRVYEPIFTKAIEWITPLPNNFVIIPDGRLYGNPDISQTANPYKSYKASFIRTNTDDSQETVNLTIYVIPENFEPASVASDDPIHITLQLEEICFVVVFGGCTYNGGNLCIDRCANSCCGPSGSKSSYSCICGGGN